MSAVAQTDICKSIDPGNQDRWTSVTQTNDSLWPKQVLQLDNQVKEKLSLRPHTCSYTM